MLSQQNNQLTKVLTRFAVMIALLVGVSLPVGYALVAYHDLSESLTFKAKVKAYAQTDLISTLPDTWMYASNRIHGILRREPVVLDDELVQIFDREGESVISVGTKITGLKIQRSYALYDIDQIVGRVVVTSPLSVLYTSILVATLLGSILGALVLLVLRLLPVRALQRISDELYTEKERAETTLHSISDAILVSDAKGRLLYSNLPADKMLGRSLVELKGQFISEILSFTDKVSGEAIDSTLAETLRSGVVTTCNERSMLDIPDKLTIAVEERSAPLFDSENHLVGGVLCLRDVTIAREYLERRSWEASHDSLTGLVNRREFENRITEIIEKAGLNGPQYVICYMDLDRFKVVNDSCGHAAGDELLVQLTRIMRSHVRESDTLARLGGDEFGLLLEGCDEARGALIATTLLTAVKDYQFFCNQQVYTVGISIGLTTITKDSFSSNDVLGQADSACYWSKEQGRHRICIYKESDSELATRRGQTGWVGKISSALRDDRFVLYHQTFRSLGSNSGSCLHLEVLIRMISEDGELILPGRFLPAAERYNLIPAVDRWVIDKVFSGFHLLEKSYPDQDLMVNINLSGASINSLDILEFIESKIVEYNVDPKNFCFEITETVAVKHMRSAIEFINACKALGIKFALDDFGTGTSSFGYLKKLPVDYLKIDGGFVQNLEKDPVDRAMTETINRIGHIMGKITIAEFAENQTIINILDDMGVDFAQGYGVCRPIPLFPDSEMDNS
ncbi:MAG: GGDEF domain-containing protein [Desulfotalea sp.]|nr:MAG: GGDEF domain-containing protein [Desulfotalea sp.]